MLFPGASFLKNVETKDRLDGGERKGGVAPKPFSKSVHMCYAVGIRKEWAVLFGRYIVPSGQHGSLYVNLDKCCWGDSIKSVCYSILFTTSHNTNIELRASIT
ncbi:hypothetical protein TNCV_4819141 [Trichonephila clavipes]|nr:hypothetical protein TNCV_4819141 [Trichonephila clavipes]